MKQRDIDKQIKRLQDKITKLEQEKAKLILKEHLIGFKTKNDNRI